MNTYAVFLTLMQPCSPVLTPDYLTNQAMIVHVIYFINIFRQQKNQKYCVSFLQFLLLNYPLIVFEILGIYKMQNFGNLFFMIVKGIEYCVFSKIMQSGWGYSFLIRYLLCTLKAQGAISRTAERTLQPIEPTLSQPHPPGVSKPLEGRPQLVTYYPSYILWTCLLLA